MKTPENRRNNEQLSANPEGLSEVAVLTEGNQGLEEQVSKSSVGVNNEAVKARFPGVFGDDTPEANASYAGGHAPKTSKQKHVSNSPLGPDYTFSLDTTDSDLRTAAARAKIAAAEEMQKANEEAERLEGQAQEMMADAEGGSPVPPDSPEGQEMANLDAIFGTQQAAAETAEAQNVADTANTVAAGFPEMPSASTQNVG